jgi:hypothetical protein
MTQIEREANELASLFNLIVNGLVLKISFVNSSSFFLKTN